jgi:hypothetical protein
MKAKTGGGRLKVVKELTMTSTTESTSITSATFDSSSDSGAVGRRRWSNAWQGTFAAVMGIALTGLVALAFGSIAERGPAVTSQACGGHAAGALGRC